MPQLANGPTFTGAQANDIVELQFRLISGTDGWVYPDGSSLSIPNANYRFTYTAANETSIRNTMITNNNNNNYLQCKLVYNDSTWGFLNNTGSYEVQWNNNYSKVCSSTNPVYDVEWRIYNVTQGFYRTDTPSNTDASCPEWARTSFDAWVTSAPLENYTVIPHLSTIQATSNVNGRLIVDGVAVYSGNYLLVKNQSDSDSLLNGVYAITSQGSVSTPWVITWQSYSYHQNTWTQAVTDPATSNSGKKFSVTNANPIMGTTSSMPVVKLKWIEGCCSCFSTSPTGTDISTAISEAGAFSLYDEGVLKGTVKSLNFTGTPITASATGDAGTVNVASTSASLEVFDEGVSKGTVTSLDFTGTSITASIDGSKAVVQVTSPAEALVWKGSWTTGVSYKKNEVIISPKNGLGFVCMEDHTSNNADPNTDDPGKYPTSNYYWSDMQIFSTAYSTGVPPTEKSFISGLMSSVYDWWTKADMVERVIGLAAGAGIIYAGAKVVESLMGNGDPKPGQGDADSRYTGTAGYNGTFTEPTLPVVVASILEFAGYTSSQYDVSLLPSSAVNFTIAQSMSSRDVLNQLALAYQFDIIPSQGTIKFVPKYQDSIRELTLDDLGHVENGTDLPAPYTAKRYQGIDLPRSIHFTYYSASLDHNTFTQIAELPTYDVGQDVSIAVPFTMTDDEAMRIVQTTLVNSHIEQQEYTFTTDYHNIDLEPGDVIRIPIANTISQVRIKEINETSDGILEFKVSRSDYNTQSYEYTGVTVSQPPAQTTNTPVSIGYSDTLFIEVPPLNSGDSVPRYYAVTHGYARPGWPGAALYKSADGGNTYLLTGSINAKSTFGLVAIATPAPTKGYYVWDDTTTISVTLKQGTLSTLTDLAVQNGQNWAMVGEELIGFVNATLTAPDTYTLSRLLRGRKGSEVKCDSHLANELFVLIDAAPLKISLSTTDIGKTLKYKTVTVGSSLDKVDAIDVQPFGLNMRPWKPAHCKVIKNGNDFVFTWVERPRLANDLKDLQEIMHDPDWAGFGVTIFGDSGKTTVKRTAVVVESTYTYTEAMQVEDFGSAQASIWGSVVQMSNVVGGGYPAVVNV